MNRKTMKQRVRTFRSTGKKLRMDKITVLTMLFFSVSLISVAQDHELFRLGSDTGSGEGFALYPARYKDFLANDFGYEDRMFWVGGDDAKTDFPYVLPDPKNGWGGTEPTAGIRSHFLNLGFVLEAAEGVTGSLKIDLADTDPVHAAHVKVLVNGDDFQFKLKKGTGIALEGEKGTPDSQQVVQIPLGKEILQNGLNRITISILDGGWIAFDHISLAATAPSTKLKDVKEAVIGEVKSANYQLEGSGSAVQPFLVEVFHLDGEPELSVKLDGKEILTQKLEQGKYVLEAGMPAITQSTNSQFEILLDGKVVKEGKVTRAPQPVRQLSGYVNTLLGTAHSRWIPGPWMPFGMVKLSPGNQNAGWQAGYDPNFESIGIFSHIHEWTMTGLGTFPTIGETIHTTVGDQSDVNSGYRSTIDKSTEYAGIGLYKLHLTDTDIWASLTATDRASFQKYEFKKGNKGRIMIDLSIPTEYGYEIEKGNAWQLTFFVPQDVPGLMTAIGKEKFLERLEWGFGESDRWRFNGSNDQYWDYPVVQGNQQSMHFAFLFNYAGKPWLAQKWSRAILDRYYGYDVTNAYLGDEDQGQMSAWFVMASMGLFQVDGGTRSEPIYEIGSPLYEKVEIKLDNRFGRGEKFTIRAKNAGRKNKYVQSATLNGKPLNQFWFEAKELLKGGELVLEMGPTPNENWRVDKLPY